MWKERFEQLAAANAGENIFWRSVDKETEMAMLHALFTAASKQGLVTDDRIERFLAGILTMLCPDERRPAASLSGHAAFDLEAAMLELLEMDRALSPLSMRLFDRPLIPAYDRGLLQETLNAPSLPRF